MVPKNHLLLVQCTCRLHSQVHSGPEPRVARDTRSPTIGGQPLLAACGAAKMSPCPSWCQGSKDGACEQTGARSCCAVAHAECGSCPHCREDRLLEESNCPSWCRKSDCGDSKNEMCCLIARSSCGMCSYCDEPQYSIRFEGNEPVFYGKDGKLWVNGEQLHVKGINWFGSEARAGPPLGLDQHDIAFYMNFLKQNGFNAIRFLVCPSAASCCLLAARGSF